MNSLGEILQRLLGRNYQLRDGLALETLKAAWPQVAAGNLKLQPCAYKNKTLFLASASAAWAQQGQYFRPVILEKYRTLCPQIVIKEIKIKATGYVEPQKPDRPDNSYPQKVCAVCGQKFWGGGRVCILCQNKKDRKIDAEIRRCLDEAPWARYRDIKDTLPQIGETRFNGVLSELQEEILFWLWRTPEKSAAVKYIMLKTGFTPDKINDNIIKEHLPKKLHKLLYEN
ncbi:protein DUF721 [Candidatus Termititenax aidoneus]|uniref:Protein DUF721 n=1 Tax=Termititenax aidoneus TaxID=2218524 RepID=A0A388T9R4_TERA1|nr:protein DUF721 [Candidatus Termititenax aidoneus]